MLIYEDLHIPSKDNNRPIKAGAIRTIADIQTNRFCSRTKEVDCFSIACESCLFSWYHVGVFKKWYRENKLKYRNLRIVSSFCN